MDGGADVGIDALFLNFVEYRNLLLPSLPPSSLTLIGRMRRPIMNHALIDGVRRLIGEHTRRQARHQLLHLKILACLHDIVVNQHILSVKLHFFLERE